MGNLLSLIAILISVFTWFKQDSLNKKINSTNLNAVFFEKIYFEIIIDKIPEAQEKIYHDPITHKLMGTEDMEKILSEIRKKSRFFRYTDETYYKELKEKSLLIDEMYVENMNLDNIEFSKFVENHEEKLKVLYSIIIHKYLEGT